MIGGRWLLAFAYQEWARENVVRAFVVVWAGAVLVWLILDWLGNPNRGRFRPLGPRRGRGLRGRMVAWRQQRDGRDAGVRETLRAVYGRSSLRLGWSNVDETTATAHDEALLSPVPQLLELGAVTASPPPVLATEILDLEWALDRDIDLTDTPAHIDLTDTDTPAHIDLTDTDTPAAAPASNGNGHHREGSAVAVLVPAKAPATWRAGDDLLAPTATGKLPGAPTVRSRAWKNHALTSHGLGEANQQRMAQGQPPRRWNPVTRQREAATMEIDGGSYSISWGPTGVDPFSPFTNAFVCDRDPTPS